METQLMGCLDTDTVYKARVAVWGIYEPTGEPICTVGLDRMHRFTMRQVAPSQANKTVLELTLLMREVLRSAGAELRAHHYLEGFDELKDVKLDEGAGRRARRAIMNREISGWRVWVEDHPGMVIALFAVVIIVLLIFAAMTGILPVGGG